MAKKSVLNRNDRRKRMIQNHKELRANLKKLAIDPKASQADRMAARQKLQSLPRDGSAVRYKNRCQLTGRSRSVYKKMMISRIVLRELAHKGLIPGMRKASW